VLAAMFLALAAGPAVAEDYPSRPITLIVPYPPGGGVDAMARIVADKLSLALGQQVIVDNRGGGGGNIGTRAVAKAAPDGYTLVMCGNGSLVIAPSLYDKLSYDPVKDFAPIARVFVAANVLAVHPDVPARTLPELVSLARQQPGKLTYGHAGTGTSQHLAAELFKYMAHIDLQPVAYRGTTALLPDLLAGRLTLSFANISNALPLAREGKLRAFAVTSIRRSGAAPDLPTMAESGFPGFEAVPCFGLMAPAGTPPAVVDKIQRETVKVLAMPEVQKRLAELGVDVIGSSPAEFAAVIASETPQWAKVIKAAGIRASE
jgi:tripartite-type tricarboxylate transporter receptor subunit TctC